MLKLLLSIPARASSRCVFPWWCSVPVGCIEQQVLGFVKVADGVVPCDSYVFTRQCSMIGWNAADNVMLLRYLFKYCPTIANQ
jgi:hypothetical protein